MRGYTREPILGHSDPKLTMRVYQQVLDMDGRALEKLEEILGCSLDEAFTTLSGRQVLAPNGHRALSSVADRQLAESEEESETHV